MLIDGRAACVIFVLLEVDVAVGFIVDNCSLIFIDCSYSNVFLPLGMSRMGPFLEREMTKIDRFRTAIL